MILATSKAGHDKGHVYVVLREDGDFVYLADGIYKTIEKPKKKKRKHIQPIQKIPSDVQELLLDETQTGDLEIKRALKLYQRRICNV